MTRILFVNPSYCNSYGGSIGAIINPIFPILSMASLTAVARKDGHETRLLDMSWDKYSVSRIEDEVRGFKPDVVAFTVLSPTMNQVKDMSYAVKQISSEILCIAGGSHVSALPRESLLESDLDAIVCGEGELTFAEIIAGRKHHNIRGLAFKNGDQIVMNERRPAIEDLDTLPMPAWDIFDLPLYAKHTSRLFAKKTPFVSAEFSRGCVYKCDFCASKLTMSLGYRKKSPERCAEEVRYMAKLGIREFMLADDIFTSDVKWATQVAEALIRDNNKVAWSCTNGIRVESSSFELFSKMKKAGCYRVAFGFESGNDEVLKKFGKGGKASLEKGIIAVKDARKAKLETIGFFQVGLSSDNKDTIYETVSFAKKLPLDMMKFGVTIAFPGTKMFSDYKAMNLIKSYNWDQYHIYSGFHMFNHPILTYEDIQKCITHAYRETTILNPAFIIRRAYKSVISGDIFRDFYDFVRFVFFSYTKKEDEIRYGYQANWKIYDFKNQDFTPETYASAFKQASGS